MRIHKVEASRITKRDTLLTYSARRVEPYKERVRNVYVGSAQVTIETAKGRYTFDPLQRVSIEAP